ncbi:nuclease-related domain-containing protein [Kurthia sp. FSL E2-0154]|uniref:nuclease-related domain-containing protein n=1 Tax=Kurthia sp. FSL E2-0154 TaxID=2921358 RepID=UPI0030FAFA64
MFIILLTLCIFSSLIVLYHRQKPLDSIFQEDEVEVVTAEQRGEALENEIVEFLSQLPGQFVLYKNFYIPLPQNKWTEIDVLMVHEKGIFVFESKNYTGDIYGTIHDSQWTKSFSETFDQRFYSPIRQNATHIRALTALIGSVKPIYSVIVFGRDADVHVDSMPADNTYICKITQLVFLYDILLALPSQISVHALQIQLDSWQLTTEETKLEHVKNIKRAYGNKAIS